jgi:hypothetical protein
MSAKTKSSATKVRVEPRAASDHPKVPGKAKAKPKPGAPIQIEHAKLGKAAMCSESLNSGFDTDLQTPSIVKRSRVSMMLERQCQWRTQMS